MASSKDYWGPWVRVRVAVLERDDYRCQIAGPRCKGKASEVDHIIPLSEGGSRLDPRNLRSVCRPCHKARGSRQIIVVEPGTGPVPSRDW